MDVLFLHVPKNAGNNLWILNMPLGLTALCDYLIKHRVSAKILHLSIEKLLDRRFNLNKYIKENNVKLVAMDLHWHQQSYSVIETAKHIKKTNKNCKILLGGFTASFFAYETMQMFKEIDFIIKGDAEIPLLELSRAVINYLDESAINKIPNLVWRHNKSIIENPQSYAADSVMMDQLSFSNIGTINNADIYCHIRDLGSRIKEISIEDLLKSKSFVFYNPGRGCAVNCSFCGGSFSAQELINKRKVPIFKSAESVLKDLAELKKHDINNIYMSFDPYPQGDYYINLFKQIKSANLGYNLIFECWALPPKEFIDAFSETFGKDSYLVLSPDAGSERIRRLNKGYYYSNAELLSVLDYLFNKKINAMIYFSAGFPFEGKKDVEETLALIDTIKDKYDEFFRISAMPIELDPASPMWLDSQKYRIRANRKCFKDVYKASKNKRPKLGYFSEDFSEKDIINMCGKLKERIYE